MKNKVKIRKTWGSMNPVQRVVPSEKQYSRAQARRELRQLWSERSADQ